MKCASCFEQNAVHEGRLCELCLAKRRLYSITRCRCGLTSCIREGQCICCGYPPASFDEREAEHRRVYFERAEEEAKKLKADEEACKRDEELKAMQCAASQIRPPMPTEIRILAKTYTVRTYPDSPLANSNYGKIDCGKGAISIEADLCHEQMADTLLHEAIHGIDYTMSAGLEERQVHALASGIYALLKDNPGLVHWLLS